MKKITTLLVTTMATMILTACGGGAATVASTPSTTAPPPTIESRVYFESALDRCLIERDASFVEIGDDGHTMTLSGRAPDIAPGEIYDMQICIFDQLSMSDEVKNHIGQTRALDGRQEDSWGAYSAGWTYHPDDGLNITITRE